MPTPLTPVPLPSPTPTLRPRPGKSSAPGVNPPDGIPPTPAIPRPRDGNSECVGFGGGGLEGMGVPVHMPRPILGACGFGCSAQGSLGARAMLTAMGNVSVKNHVSHHLPVIKQKLQI